MTTPERLEARHRPVNLKELLACIGVLLGAGIPALAFYAICSALMSDGPTKEFNPMTGYTETVYRNLPYDETGVME